MSDTTERPPGDARSPNLGERISDSLNPILVREVQQALYGRGFFGLLVVSAIIVVVLGFLFAAMNDSGVTYEGSGGRAFDIALACLVPVATLLIPSQCFHSMRHEVQGGVAEQLALTRLRPRGIVLGKVLAGSVQLVLIVAMFAPLLALTFLLRGIDVPTIAASIVMLLAIGFTACAFAVGTAAVGGPRTSKQLVQFIAFVALIIGTFLAVMASQDMQRALARAAASPEIRLDIGIVLFGLAMGSALFVTIGVTSLAHSYENRSAPFRLFAVFAVITAWVLAWLTIETDQLARQVGDLGSNLALLLAPIWAWAVCEDYRMSPRVAAHVPRSPVRAVLIAPVLPGAPRGVLLSMLLMLLAIGGAELLAWLDTSRSGIQRADRGMYAAWSYVLFLGAVGAAFRRTQPPGAKGSKRCFAFLLGFVALGSVLPWAVALLAGMTLDQRWKYTNILNPVHTVSQAEINTRAFHAALALGVLGLVGSAVLAYVGLRDVSRASRVRRERLSARKAGHAS
jgi:hypothetical protein